METIAEIVKNEIPQDFLNFWINKLRFIFDEAKTITENNFKEPEASNLLPYHFNAKADQLLRDIAEDFPQIKVKILKNENNYKFTLLELDNIILTQKVVASPGDMVKPSEFRKALALGNSFFSNDFSPLMFPEHPILENINSKKIYGILTHNRSSVFKKNGITFNQLVFPDSTFKYYIEKFDLNDSSSETVILPNEEIVEIKDEITPTLKIKKTMEKNA